MTYTKDNSFFMCHRCLHTFYYKADVKRHLSKQKKCEPEYNCLMPDHEIFIKSTHKRYYFPYVEVLPLMEKHHLVKLVSEYYQAVNIITDVSILNNTKLTTTYGKADSDKSSSDLDGWSQQTSTDLWSAKKVDEVQTVVKKVNPKPVILDGKPTCVLPHMPPRSLKEMMNENINGVPSTCTDNDDDEDDWDDNDNGEDGDDYHHGSVLLSEAIQSLKHDDLEEIPDEQKKILFKSLLDFISSSTKTQKDQKYQKDQKDHNETAICSDMNRDMSQSQSSTAMVTNDHMKPSFVTEDGKPKYQCNKCEMYFTRKDSYVRHMKSSKRCQQDQVFTELNKSTKGQVNNYNSVYNISNNVQNVQNNGHNHNKIEVKVRDFFGDPFEYIHIPNELVHDKEFFLHQNFIQHVFENDVNKNIYFENKYAFIYTNKGLTRIPSDKAVYLILDKLDSAIGSYLRSNSLINPDDYEFVMRFYSVVTKKFLTDSIHRVYDAEKREFIPFETKNIRTRDKFMSEVIQCLSKIKGRTKELLQLLINNSNGEIDSNYKLSIPFFESTRTRNKGFEEKF